MSKDEIIFCKHLAETAFSAYHKQIRKYTDFLNMNEISIFHAMMNEIPDIAYSIWGGAEGAERVKICFHGDLDMLKHKIDDMDIIKPSLYPIACIHIMPSDYKFSDVFMHRDILGAVLNLGLSRSKIGDILFDEKDAYVFCDDIIKEFIMNNLLKVKHTNVSVKLHDFYSKEIVKKYEIITGSVSSIRLDSVIKTAFHVSRSSILPYINGGKVFVNGKETNSTSLMVKEGDIISVRGMGKFRYDGQTGMTKKGRINIRIHKYTN